MKKTLYSLISAVLALSFGFAAMADTILPPSGVTATSTTPTSVNLSWASSTGAVSYQVFRDTTTAPIATTTGLSFADTGLTPSTTYAYFLTAVDASSTASALSTSTSAATLADTDVPSVPTNLSAVATSTTEISLSWTASTDIVGVTAYKIYVDGATTSVANAASTNIVIGGFLATTTHSFQVSAVDAVGHESAKSNTATATTLAVNPVPAPTPTATSTIFIQKGDQANKQINIRSNQMVKIVVLGTAELDVKNINNSTAYFGGAKRWSIAYKDYNKDGRRDVIYGFRAGMMKDLVNGTTTAAFKAKTKDNKDITANITVFVKGSPKKALPAKVSEKKAAQVETKIQKVEAKFQSLIQNITREFNKKMEEAKKKKALELQKLTAGAETDDDEDDNKDDDKKGNGKKGKK